uniref:PDZ domain-containing protein n=1 Tax=Plectus sambesii TaxID=2011161 RepID=A0A914VS75_9BILA
MRSLQDVVRLQTDHDHVMNASTALTPVIEEVDLNDTLPAPFQDDDDSGCGEMEQRRPRLNTVGPLRVIKTLPELNEPSVSRSTDCSPLHKSDTRASRSQRTLLGSLARSRLYHSLSSLDRKGKLWSKFYCEEDENVKRVLEAVAGDHSVVTHPSDNRKRRTVVIRRAENERFGFVVQSYLLKRPQCGTLEQVSYVDYVELNSPATTAGLRAGDVIVSINGRLVKEQTHEQLIAYIGTCREMRMVVLFENYVHRIDLCSRAIRLKKLLADKHQQLSLLEIDEQRLLNKMPPLSRDEKISLLTRTTPTSSSLSSLSGRLTVDIDGISMTSFQSQDCSTDDAQSRHTVSSEDSKTPSGVGSSSSSGAGSSSSEPDVVVTRL